MLPHLSPDVRKEALSTLSFVRHSKSLQAKDGRLNQNGCSTSIGFYHKPPFLLEVEEDQISFLDLIGRAEVAVIAEVVSTQPGIVGGSMGTLINFKLIENIKNSTVPENFEWHYRSLEYAFEVNGELFCRQRDGFYRERAGDVVLFIGRLGRPERRILPYGVFEIKGGVIMPQPYEFLLPFDPMKLSEINPDLN